MFVCVGIGWRLHTRFALYPHISRLPLSQKHTPINFVSISSSAELKKICFNTMHFTMIERHFEFVIHFKATETAFV